MAQTPDGGDLEIWGDGQQKGSVRLMRSEFTGPVNLGSEEMVTINQLVDLIMAIAGKTLRKKTYPRPPAGPGPQSP